MTDDALFVNKNIERVLVAEKVDVRLRIGEDGKIEGAFFQKSLHRGRIVGRNGEEYHVFAGKIFAQSIQMRHFGHTGRAAGKPEIDQGGLAFEVAPTQQLAVKVAQFKVGKLLPHKFGIVFGRFHHRGRRLPAGGETKQEEATEYQLYFHNYFFGLQTIGYKLQAKSPSHFLKIPRQRYPKIPTFTPHNQPKYMAQLRTNHSQSGSASGTIVRVGLFAAILSAMFYLFNLFSGKGNADSPETPAADNRPKSELPDFLPRSSTRQIIDHQYFWLSYDEEHEQAEWTAHILSKENLEKPWVDRQDDFRPDDKIKTGSATPNDYRNSGYDRGHLVPAADMAHDAEAMRATFVMSNMSPQARNFNNGVWRELEELTRNWAKRNGKLYVITGPVLSMPVKGTIGENEVSIPAAFFKVLLDADSSNPKAIAFLVPNEISFDPLTKYVVSVDEVEKRTGLDFFPDLLDEDTEKQLESRFNVDLWEFSKQKFQQRVNAWNKQQ